jgi:transcriptional regulator with XRE-family HTH domain
MSIIIIYPNDLRQANSPFWGRIFGLSIQSGRKKKAYSVEEAARLAGMEPSTWLAIEAGRVPETAAQLRSMASALNFSDAQLGTLVLLCRGAWEA